METNTNGDRRTEIMSQNAIGKTMRVLVRKATKTQSGIVETKTVASAPFARWRERGCSKVAQFDVTFTDGTTMLLEVLPR